MRLNRDTLIVMGYVLVAAALGIAMGFMWAEILHYPLPRIPNTPTPTPAPLPQFITQLHL